MGAPSAALVLADLAELGVRRAVRVGTCLGAAGARAGELLLVESAIAAGGSAASFGLAPGEAVAPDPGLTAALGEELGGETRTATVASFDLAPADAAGGMPAGAAGADLQTVAILARARSLGIAAAAILIVAESGPGEQLADDDRDEAAKRAGRAVLAVL